jgi:hypothetical protein
VAHLLRTAPLETLLVKDDELVHQVKGLDSDMQMLVYENYSKFIAATDTIRKMKGDVETMEAEMDQLVRVQAARPFAKDTTAFLRPFLRP